METIETKPDDNGDGSQEQQIDIIASEASIKTVKSVATVTVENPPPPTPPPENEKYIEKWRKYSRYVAYADMAVTVSVFAESAVLGALVGTELYQAHQEHGFEEVEVTGPVVLFLCFSQLLSHINGFWSACKLYVATNPLTPRPEAIEKAKSWRNFEIYKIVLALVIGLAASKDGPSVGSINFLWFILPIGFVCIVHKFIYEMEKNVDATGAIQNKKSAASVRPVMMTTISEKVSAIQQLTN